MVGDDTPWLTSLVGGLPADFDYGMIRSADDARSLIPILPGHDRGAAARGLHGHRWLVGTMLRIAEGVGPRRTRYAPTGTENSAEKGISVAGRHQR
jgi:hypothetical protein